MSGASGPQPAGEPAGWLQVVTTVGSREEAEQLATLLVERRLVACAQIVGPVTSVYRWRGRVETAQEHQVLLKTRRALYGRLEHAIRQHHSYELPEIIALEVVAGLPGYLSWIDQEVGSGDASAD